MIVEADKPMIKLSPSILAADFSCIVPQLTALKNGGAHYVHLDIMDGHFVPNISIGPPVVAALRKHTDLVFDVHLMIANPKEYIERFVSAGADIITFHTEACWHPDEVMRIIDMVHARGKKVGISIKPDTAIQSILRFVPHVDMVLIMSVYPGFGGQGFIAESLWRARQLRDFANKIGKDLDIEMDGGITTDNVRDLLDAGVNVIVAGSDIFNGGSIEAATQGFISIFEEHMRAN